MHIAEISGKIAAIVFEIVNRKITHTIEAIVDQKRIQFNVLCFNFAPLDRTPSVPKVDIKLENRSSIGRFWAD